MIEWDIEKRRSGCRLCDGEFREGDDVVSAVFPKAKAFVRRDYCASCYDRRPFRPFSFWKSRALAAKARRIVTIDRVFAFFEKVVASPVPEHRRVAYLLSLWLMRKRALVLRETVSATVADPEVFRLEDGDGRSFRVENPRIDLESVEALEKELQSLLALTVETETSVASVT
ncbi:MAG: hypothetical protein HYR85_01125 [Planctomycetes bacterium]|nr:hypothetical protein [Planctomycetota bacterium]MBI3847019.1 hypothetical protein [Planctomycetota bacterium]